MRPGIGPGFGRQSGFITSATVIAVLSALLYATGKYLVTTGFSGR
ncbi:hypothetical protein [Streptomyces sp. YIM S03343]